MMRSQTELPLTIPWGEKNKCQARLASWTSLDPQESVQTNTRALLMTNTHTESIESLWKMLSWTILQLMTLKMPKIWRTRISRILLCTMIPQARLTPPLQEAHLLRRIQLSTKLLCRGTHPSIWKRTLITKYLACLTKAVSSNDDPLHRRQKYNHIMLCSFINSLNSITTLLLTILINP